MGESPALSLVLAPMRGVTTVHYRQAFALHFGGLDAEMAPFISTVRADRIAPKLLRDILPEKNLGLPLIPQLIGNNADDFIQMAKAVYALGYEEINWNLGCPHKPIRRKRRGSGLLPYPEIIDSFLTEVCKKIPCRLSVKVRLGVSEKTELLRLVPLLNAHPLSEVVIHPRTAEQMYEGRVDLDAFEEVAQRLQHPICYNGDIDSVLFFRQLQGRFPQINRFMLGRGLLKNPLLAEMLKADIGGLPAPSACDVLQRIYDFHKDLLVRYEAVLDGDHPVLGKMKEFWSYQHQSLPNGRKLFKKLKKVQRLSSYRAILETYFAEHINVPNQGKPRTE